MRRALLLGMAVMALAAAAPLATIPISRANLPWWRARFEAKLREAQARPVQLVFLGDSITQQWEQSGPPAWRDFRPVWQHFYGDREALNLGFKGDATSHLLWRLQHGEVAGLHPRVAVIMIGANNLGRLHWPEAADVAGIEAVVAETRRQLPGAQILLLGVLPSDRGAWVLQTTAAINRALAARYGDRREPGVTFLDLSPLFLRRDGRVDDAAFVDPHLTPPEPALHPDAAAAARMAAAMEPTLARLFGDRAHAPYPARRDQAGQG